MTLYITLIFDMKGKKWFSVFFVVLIGYELSFGQEDMYRIQMDLKYRTWSNNRGHSICEANFFLNIFGNVSNVLFL